MISHQQYHQPGAQSGATGRLRPSNPFRELRQEDVEQSVPARFQQIALEYPDRLALKDEQRGYTYRELDEYANRIAHAILDQGMPPQSPMAVMVEQGFLHIAAILGILKAGGIFVALDPANPASRIQHMVADSEARLMIADRRSRPLAAGLAENVRLVSLAVEEIDPSLPCVNPNVTMGPDEIACLVYTSGSTGVPKGSVVPHRYLLRHVLKCTNAMHISHLDRMTLLSSAGVGAAVGTITVALMNGACVLPFSVQTNGLRALGDWLGREEVTVYHSVPTLFRHFAQNLAENTVFPSLRLIWLSGEPVLRREVDLFKSRFAGSVLLCNSLGSTEGGAIAEYYISRETPFDGAVLPVGYEADGMRVIVVDEEGNEVPPGQIGEITVRIRTRGYWRRPGLTEAIFLHDSEGGDRRIYKTGDVGYMLPDRCLVHLGRKDSQVKIRGHRIELAEVEMALMDLPVVREAVVAARKDILGDPRLVAYVVPEGGAAPSASTLRHQLGQRLPDYMIPAHFVTLDTLPIGPSGKVDQLRLPDPPADDGREADVEPEADADSAIEGEIAGQVAHISKRLLGLHRVGPDDNFFDLGGDSLLATRMALEIEKQFKVRLPMDVLFDQPTPVRLAAAIALGSHANLGDCLVPIFARGSRPPFYCVHGVRGALEHYWVLAGHLGSDQPVYGLRPRSVSGNYPLSFSVEEMASHYVEDILAFQPDGPYFLGGYSAGGVFAFEVARQLRNKGCAVGLVALFDTACPGHARRTPVVDRARRHLAVMSRLTLRQRLNYLRNRFGKHYWSRLFLRLLYQAMGRGVPVDRTIETLDKAIEFALSNYRPHPYPGRLVVFAAVENEGFSFDRQNPLEGWRAVAAEGVQFCRVPGDHANVMQEPQVATLAGELGACIRMIQDGG
ncbi:MAG: amino acid adenylation domain-containing protein [Chloroflexi bacterium]|nr:amino acid adenylation domain-containing protein [Chloroflexota bacterium]